MFIDFSFTNLQRLVLLLTVLCVPTSLAQNLQVRLSSSDGEAIEGAIIELALSDSQKAAFAGMAEAEVDQIEKEFVPSVTAVVAGSQVDFPNSDDILHHVYSFSPVKTFNIPLYGGEDSNDYTEVFPETGVVEIGCNIHDWMLAYIYIGESGAVAISDQAGNATLTNIPAGEYEYKVWHARSTSNDAAQLRTVTIPSSGTATQSVVLELARDRRVRRAPSASRSRYR